MSTFISIYKNIYLQRKSPWLPALQQIIELWWLFSGQLYESLSPSDCCLLVAEPETLTSGREICLTLRRLRRSGVTSKCCPATSLTFPSWLWDCGSVWSGSCSESLVGLCAWRSEDIGRPGIWGMCLFVWEILCVLRSVCSMWITVRVVAASLCVCADSGLVWHFLRPAWRFMFCVCLCSSSWSSGLWAPPPSPWSILLSFRL